MRVAANIIAVLAWGSVLATLWVGLMAEVRPPLAPLVGALVLSFLIGIVVPSYLLNLENRHGLPTADGRPSATRESRQ